MAPGRWSSSYSSLGSTSTTCAPSPMSRWTSLRLMACGIGTSPADSTRPADSRRSVLYARRPHTSTALHPAATDYAALDRCGRCRQDLPANATVKHVMEVSGFNSLLHLYETEADALATFA